MRAYAGTLFVISGGSFGPSSLEQSVPTLRYGDGSVRYAATGCLVLSDSQMSCVSAAGAGTAHRIEITVGGQSSGLSEVAVDYGTPIISGFGGVGASSAPSEGGVSLRIFGI